MKLSQYFTLILIVVIVVEILFLIHKAVGMRISVEEGISMVDTLTIWAAVITIVFLVFSVMGLMNIDRKIDEVENVRLKLQKEFKRIEKKSEEIICSSDEVKKEIIQKSNEQIKAIINKSTKRINFFDALVTISRYPDLDRQIVEYTEFLRENKEVDGIDLAYIYINRGHAYLQLQKMPESYADFETAIDICLEMNKANAYMSMGLWHVRNGDYEKSIEYYQKALAHNPESAGLCMDIGNSYGKIGKFDEAEKYYIKALAYNPDMAGVYYNKANKLRNQHGIADCEQLMAYLNKCLEINPTFIPARINKAAVYRDMKQEQDAIDELNKVICPLYNEDFIMSVLQRGIAYRVTNQHPLALNDFLFVLTYSPHNVQNLSNLALTTLQMGYLQESSFYADLGLKEANAQNNHSCDKEMFFVLNDLIRIGYASLPKGTPDETKSQ